MSTTAAADRTTATALRTDVAPVGPRQDRIGRAIMALNAVAALAAFASGLVITAGVTDDRLLSEMWRTLAYLVFAGIWTVLAVSPRRHPGLWELLLLHKGAVTVFAFVMWDRLADAPETALVDLGVTVTTLVAYVLCRGWRAWGREHV
ncbi:hypothetical protein AB6N24_14470 [Cellulomonas sp. 179-A 4D5 NHS]|uniref:hypothetical protein n=1 Tax=Cellulomonas sp. 179-A 4D5 NHS TaxID=3142378 RepID=UPI0039A29543